MAEESYVEVREECAEVERECEQWSEVADISRRREQEMRILFISWYPAIIAFVIGVGVLGA